MMNQFPPGETLTKLAVYQDPGSNVSGRPDAKHYQGSYLGSAYLHVCIVFDFLDATSLDICILLWLPGCYQPWYLHTSLTSWMLPALISAYFSDFLDATSLGICILLWLPGCYQPWYLHTSLTSWMLPALVSAYFSDFLDATSLGICILLWLPGCYQPWYLHTSLTSWMLPALVSAYFSDFLDATSLGICILLWLPGCYQPRYLHTSLTSWMLPASVSAYFSDFLAAAWQTISANIHTVLFKIVILIFLAGLRSWLWRCWSGKFYASPGCLPWGSS